MAILTTDRLILREFEITDAADLYELNIDPEVIKYTGDKSFNSIKDAEDLIKNYTQYKTYGYGRWAVITKDTNEFIGWCGLKYLPDTNETDLGFRFFRKHWNKGYATESSILCLDIGFSQFGLDTIVGKVMTANIASIKVLEKVGMTYWKDFDFDGHPGQYYKIEK